MKCMKWTIGVWAALLALPAWADSPVDVSGLALWLDADDFAESADGTPVSTWTDKSGNIAFSTFNKAPEVRAAALNGCPTVRFYREGVNRPHGLQADNAAIGTLFNNPNTQFVVGRATSGAADNGTQNPQFFYSRSGYHSGPKIVGYPDATAIGNTRTTADSSGGGPNDYVGGTAPYTQGEFVVLTLVVHGSSSTRGASLDCFVNNEKMYTDSKNEKYLYNHGQAANVLRIGCSNNGQDYSGCLEGDIAEIMVFNRELTEEEQTKVYNYLNRKWDISSPFVLANTISGDRKYVSTNIVAIVGTPLLSEGMEWQISMESNAANLSATSWNDASVPIPTTFTFPRPACDGDVTVYFWTRTEGEDSEIFAAPATIRYTTAVRSVAVKNIVCAQRYPWNGMVDIDYEVVCDDPNADVWVYATGYDGDLNVSMAPRALSGDGAEGPVKPGKHRMTWNVTADYSGFATTSFSVKMCALTGGAPYMVVDLSGGVDALEYPVSYLDSVPAGGWTDEYKTTKMVFRLIPPGTFLMGSPNGELGRNSEYAEIQHKVTLTKPFYIGVFEVTQRQWFNVMGTSKGDCKTGDTVPANGVSFNDIRGTLDGAAWPAHNQVDADSFMGRLRSKANMMFDLPTESQWEYACRAGTTSALNNGKNLTTTGDNRCTNLDEVAWYYPRSGNYPTTVGNYLPNAWGLYDMHGNVVEWCLDWLLNDWGSSAQIDPKGPTSGQNGCRVLRGGGCYSDRGYIAWDSSWWGRPERCRSATRLAKSPSNNHHFSGDYFGFRVACFPAD